MKKIILASNSLRRKEILSIYTKDFDILTADIDEKIDSNNNLQDEILKLSFQKAEKIYKSNPDKIVIGADTVVTINNQVLGKPKNFNEARKMLNLLSGKTHKVITAATVISNNKIFQNISVNKVYFKKLSENEINNYILSKEPQDKAGAYAIQGYGGCFIKKIEGDFYAVMGLPLNFIYETLETILNK